ncbi:putative glycerol-3-phosphate transporter 5 [Andrographis paniculata]|uniref:putative glycerol-3-phosphate transporter 5 n=1 Tax=Andrographis paniculata TaxID=175694 RepID=UPI0021E9AD8D|nr:putative glycerol-3-phosphate transporter 5 [Andrographis paniculata]XP_051140876.1 putative glycerol-3-phosphate transporter 5 [Andrographis paniculata]XP_051140877.1 putative glycerol-3-phosphate transporter 5 [Andrographis paniculata]XP_051140878.1 putative glycerol-3-phosphate transporter 5 [Andrographis paniculata]XP_051140879.1 putative glycerol-3-phosphate transporter 5 [Andrographis paniculata]XP_051140880.1 putative glycerol-3-phosphate transporter 5 [Andrographis paniculata]
MQQLSSQALAPPRQLPPGVRWFPSLASPERSLKFHKFLVLLLTFAAYASFHASRKPPSIVKSILTSPINESLAANTSSDQGGSESSQTPSQGVKGWPPFDGPRGPHHLGELDLSFLLAYAIGMYFSGHVADSIDLRIFLTVGMVGSGIFVILFGLGYFLDLHSLGAFVFIQVFCGLFQSIGWPCVVAVVGNWFGKAKRGLIMGVWNSHTSVGNILGSLVASAVLLFGWGWSFVVPGILIILVATFIYIFLVVRPENVGMELSEEESTAATTAAEGIALVDSGEAESVDGEGVETEDEGALVPIGFLDAWRLPHVASYAFCLFFSKLVAYTFLYWLPFYIRHTAVAGVHLSHKTAGILSTVFDIGGVVGGVMAGFVSDIIEARGVTALMFLILSIPMLILYRLYGSVSMLTNIALMFMSGLLVNGPYALITTAVAADLGTQSLEKGNSRALATVTAIIDGTGSVGAALGPLLAGYISTRGWNSVFFMLIVSILFAGFLLFPVVKNEIRGKWDEGKWIRFA